MLTLRNEKLSFLSRVLCLPTCVDVNVSYLKFNFSPTTQEVCGRQEVTSKFTLGKHDRWQYRVFNLGAYVQWKPRYLFYVTFNFLILLTLIIFYLLVRIPFSRCFCVLKGGCLQHNFERPLATVTPL